MKDWLKKTGDIYTKVKRQLREAELPFDLDTIRSKTNFDGLREHVVKLSQNAIRGITREEDRREVVKWLQDSKNILDDDFSKTEKVKKLYASIDSVKSAKIFMQNLAAILKKYMESNLPLPIKVAIPVTALATIILGVEGAGIAAFGGAIGLPVVALFFIGSAGITAIVEPFLNKNMSESAKGAIAITLAALGVFVLNNKLKKSLEEKLKKEALTPKRQQLSKEEEILKNELQNMDPIDFERHVLSFFEDLGMKASVTKASNDFGIDGWAIHENGLIIVQCKRNSDQNKVGRPVIQQFKGVVEEQRKEGNQIYKGYIVSTSTFSREAFESATKNEDIVLVDINLLIKWHESGIEL